MTNPKLATLVDAFTAAALNTAVWNAATPGAYSVDPPNGLASLAVGTSAGTYNSLGASGPYDATGSSLYAQVSPAPNGNGGVQTILKLDAGGGNAVQIVQASGGAFFAQVVTAGSYATTNLPAYDPHLHRWWRIRETGGSWVIDTAADGLNWTPRLTLPYSWSAAAVAVYMQTGATDTEPAGMAAGVQHVNTPLGGPYNPNWPVVEDAWGAAWGANAGAVPGDRYVEVTDRTRGSVSVSRGRQYELDQVRSGEASLTLANTDAALDPTNASGPWYGHITPYQPYRRRAQWPPTRNLLEQAQATGGDLGGYAAGAIPAGAEVFSSTDSTGGSFVASASAWQGGTVMQFSVPSGSASGARVCHTPRTSVVPGQTYTVSLRVRDVTTSTSLSVKALLGWYTAGGGADPVSYSYGSAAALTGSASAGWATVTVTATAPSNAAGLDCGVALASTAGATCALQVDGWQLEKAAAPSAWACPGVWYPVYAGFTERWPSQWDMQGTYGLVAPACADPLALLSQVQLSDPLSEEISDLSPRFLYRLDDPAGSVSVADSTGAYPAAPVAISKYGAGSLTFGNEITATDSTGVFTGSTGPVARFNNPDDGGVFTTPATFLKLSGAGIKGPSNPALWTRMIAFRYTGAAPLNDTSMWSGNDTKRDPVLFVPTGSGFGVGLSGGQPAFGISGPTGAGGNIFFGGATNCLDGDWHLLIFGYSEATGTLFASQDGSTSGWHTGYTSAITPTGLISDNIGAYNDPIVGDCTSTFRGDMAFAAEFPTALTPTQVSNLYAAWKSACSGESTDARYARILRYAGYAGSTSLQSGLTTSMGPATGIGGQDAVTALQAVVDTEDGAHYVDRAGVITFKARTDRYNTSPVYILGENAAAGEWPYEDIATDYDPTHLANQVTVTQESSGQNFYADDGGSKTAYFTRTLTRTINTTSANECQDAANYLLSRYRQPATRVSTLKLHPSANPAMWPVCLSLELGTRVRVVRRPPGVPATQLECFVEQIQWDFGDDGEAWVTLQCSPADITPYGIFAAWHTTLNGSITSGVGSITVNASADNTNPLAAQLAPGQQLVVGLNTANAETVTVKSVGATSPGWTTAAITLTTNTTHSHSAGDTVCEPLPAGVTSPAAYDPSAVFDAVAFTY